MKEIKFLSLVFAGLLIVFSSSAVKAQDEMPPPDAPVKQFDRPRRPNLMAELGLTQNQRQQIRRINVEKRPLLREAQQRLREANRNLDQAIYADNVIESEIQARLKEVQTAQAELIKMRLTNELAVRRLLTAEQLSKFRDLRERFSREMENNQDRRQQRRGLNLRRRFNNRQRQLSPKN
jgi:Spy/CpxP family protein refolding chaperone